MEGKDREPLVLSPNLKRDILACFEKYESSSPQRSPSQRSPSPRSPSPRSSSQRSSPPSSGEVAFQCRCRRFPTSSPGPRCSNRDTRKPDRLAEAPGRPRGASVSSDEYDYAVRGPLRNDGWIREEDNPTYSDDEEEPMCWHCLALKAKNESIEAEFGRMKAENAAVKAENKNLKAQIDHLKQASHDRMIYNLFHDSA
jgi:hypothetical protein